MTHPVTPPPELVRQWCDESVEYNEKHYFHQISIATRAAQWGADQELEACISWLLLNGWGQASNGLRAARRPKPPSLKEQALEVLERSCFVNPRDAITIRLALESIDD
jgi:hypothetical protein